ncbi:6-hydroxymethylpterin diphosphokinase MptE-like protein [Cohnella sp.]|uniref:motility associated factor glycosyltransferase family protein n=1 Tax=Cohnella sp. TaxID=1883426 RepID=UPI003568381B
MGGETFEIESALDEIKRFLPGLIEACEDVSELFYESVTEQTWQMFGQLVQAMDDLYRASKTVHNELVQIGDYATIFPVFANFISEFSEQFETLNRHVDEEEFVQAGDHIQYELASLFLHLKSLLGDEQPVKERRFAANLAFLKQHFAHVYEAIRGLELDRSRYQVTYARNGLPNLCVATADNKMISFYSHYDPHHEAERWAESIAETINGKSNVLVFGFGLGYHMLQLARKYPEHQLVIFEPDEQLLLAAMEAVDFQELFSQINIKLFIAGWNKTLRDSAFYYFARREKGKTAITAIPVYDRLDIRKKLDFFEDAKTAIMLFEVSTRTRNVFGFQWLQNKLFNIAHIVNTPSIRGLQDKLEGITAVIVGAGPSLEADIETLRKLKDHALIIAAGTSIQSLKHFGITPHLIVSVDGSEANYDAFSHLDVNDVPFLYNPLIQNKIIENKNKLFHFLIDGDLTSRYTVGWTMEDPVFSSPPSVTGPAIQGAIYMGCKDIVFTGQDFSYPGTHIYAPGAKHVSQEQSDSMIETADMQVENVRGGMNRTNKMMRVTLSEIEKVLEMYPGIRFINTSQVGAKIKCTEWQQMESVLKRSENVIVPHNFMDESMAKYLQPYSESRKMEITNRLFQMPGKLAKMETTLKRIEQKLGGLRGLGRMKPNKCQNIMVEIEQMWEPIMKNELFTALIAVAIPIEVLEYDRNLPELAQEKNVIKKADLFCEVLGTFINAMKNCLPQLNEIVQEAVRRVELRMQMAAAEEL